MKKTKVMTILGTRPEIIRLARVMAKLDEFTDHVIVHTGQNYDYELNEIFFKDLGIRKPDHFLGVRSGSLGDMIGKIISGSEKILLKEKPDAVVILGDTNSALAGIMAKRLKIPIYHMEAGNRCFDQNVPEEINRKIIDHISDFNLVYTENARRNLLSEGLHPRRIYLTGSPMKEVLYHYLAKIEKSLILSQLKLKKEKYFVVSMHREENVDNEENLKKLVLALNLVAKEFGYPVIVSTHPRTKKHLEKIRNIKLENKISFLKPFGFFDYVNLQMNSFCVLSDSGTISEESSILSFPAITMRNAMERPEAMDSGNIVLTGIDSEVILQAIKAVVSERKKISSNPIPYEYTITNTSQRVLRLIIGMSKLSNRWDGIIKNTK
ncbi:MAG: UDP-N-acetylglucosamine 2-epimerase (non-hydrolyzing) [Elusimicrobia bacterium]|nr:UDP-N-acetylglucosamine 2-epimerase (non-hydrolyzing) [Candidatus Liberimonas magnetica]